LNLCLSRFLNKLGDMLDDDASDIDLEGAGRSFPAGHGIDL
jgi:hypothetical protein